MRCARACSECADKVSQCVSAAASDFEGKGVGIRLFDMANCRADKRGTELRDNMVEG